MSRVSPITEEGTNAMGYEKKCGICKIVALLAGIGALNWGLVALFNLDLVYRLLGGMPVLAKAVYVLVGIAGLLVIVSLFKCCPCCNKGSSCSSGK